jgi:hypothetical protein
MLAFIVFLIFLATVGAHVLAETLVRSIWHERLSAASSFALWLVSFGASPVLGVGAALLIVKESPHGSLGMIGLLAGVALAALASYFPARLLGRGNGGAIVQALLGVLAVVPAVVVAFLMFAMTHDLSNY